MKGIKLLPLAIVLIVLLALSAGLSAAQGPASQGSPQAMLGTAFTYQGELRKDGNPVNDTCTMAFRLYDDPASGNLVGNPITLTVPVADGLFTAEVNGGNEFGFGAFSGEGRWLEIAVQCPGDAAFNTLTPRQALTAAPYALSLRPGAMIDGAVEASNALVVVNRATSGYGVWGQSDATDGIGVRGFASASSGTTYGVHGEVYSSEGRGVVGYAHVGSGDARGVYGRSNSSAGTGVYGWATASSGATYGVYGLVASNSGVGVYGYNSSTSSGIGVYGVAPNAVVGDSSTPNYGAVVGRNFATTGTGMGLYGETYSSNGRGVHGYANTTSGDALGVYGRSDAYFGTGVYGYATGASATGVYGEGTNTGVDGLGPTGVHGETNVSGGYGVLGYSGSDTGTSYGVFGVTNSTDGWAGRFLSSPGNGVSITSNAGKVGLVVAGGTKSAVVRTADGSRLLYTEESAEVWFTDYGFGQLMDGSATVAIDPLYAQTVNLDEPYLVFLTPQGDCGLYVTDKTSASFTVRALDGKTCSIAFDYRIVAKRLGFEDTRLGRAPWADDDPILYPEKGPASPALSEP